MDSLTAQTPAQPATPREAEARAYVEVALVQLVDGAETRDQRDARTFLAR